MDNTFKASWGIFLIVMTSIASIILLGCIVTGLFGAIGIITVQLDEYYILWNLFMFGIPGIIIISTLFSMVRKYEIQDSKLLIHRLLWKKVIDLSNITSVEFDPKAVKSSIRLFGNGGLFVFSGIYRNKKLGNYVIFATDFKNSVVIKTKEKTSVVTPENPGTFVKKLKSLIKNRTEQE